MTSFGPTYDAKQGIEACYTAEIASPPQPVSRQAAGGTSVTKFHLATTHGVNLCTADDDSLTNPRKIGHVTLYLRHGEHCFIFNYTAHAIYLSHVAVFSISLTECSFFFPR